MTNVDEFSAWAKKTKIENRTERIGTEAERIEPKIRFLILRNRNNRRKFGSYSWLTKLTERIELHVLYSTYLYFVRLYLVYVWCFIFELLYICVTILLLFPNKLLLLKIDIVLHKFASEHVHFLLKKFG